MVQIPPLPPLALALVEHLPLALDNTSKPNQAYAALMSSYASMANRTRQQSS